MTTDENRTEEVNMPGLLAGPILRRAEPGAVHIWIATGRPYARVNATVYRVAGDRSTDPVGSGQAQSVRLGEHLYVHLITATPTMGAQFPTGVLLAYDIELFASADQPGGERLAHFGLTDRDTGVVYDGIDLPTFFLRGQAGDLVVLHGSCRKLHGEGYDALATADQVIGQNLHDLASRPGALFLTGDQVYADDVAGPLITHLARLGCALVGREEQTPGVTGELGLYERQVVMEQTAMLTSEEAANHLVTFGEFAAMYLVAWSEANWPGTFEIPPGLEKEQRERYEEELAGLEKARSAIRAVRRVLANVPTYMIFDDHEITDDWNLTLEWYENVKNSPCGRRIVANGLAAYWAFQGWGNDPGRFDGQFRASVEGYLSPEPTVDAETFEALLWGFRGWGYYAPTSPPALVLDTRTQRDFEGKATGPARLVGREGLLALDELARRAGHQPGQPLLIVSPTPVFGVSIAEEMQGTYGAFTNNYKADREAWWSNPRGVIDLLSYLIDEREPDSCVILSGDVHYAFSISASFSKGDRRLALTQLTSSAQKNSSGLARNYLGHLRAFVDRVEQVIGWDEPPSSRIAELEKGLFTNWVFPLAEIRRRLQGRPVLFTPGEAEYLEIATPSAWSASRTYAAIDGHSHSPLVGENNLGLVRVGAETVEHRLYVPGEDGVEVCKATMQLKPDDARERHETELAREEGERAKWLDYVPAGPVLSSAFVRLKSWFAGPFVKWSETGGDDAST